MYSGTRFENTLEETLNAKKQMYGTHSVYWRQLRLVVLRQTKYPVDEDLWIPGAAPPGEQQYVEAVVSETLLLRHATAHLVQQVSGDGSAQSSS